MTITPEEKAKIEDDLYAQIGRITIGFGGLDNCYAVVLSSILTPQREGFEMAISAPVIFQTQSGDQRQNLIKTAFKAYFSAFLGAGRNTNERRAADYMLTMIESAFQYANSRKWVRNIAAHGNINWYEGEPHLSPPIFDEEALKMVADRGYAMGLNKAALVELAKDIPDVRRYVWELSECVRALVYWTPMPVEFLEKANALSHCLGMEPLRLKDQSEGPPRRGTTRSRKNRAYPRS